MARVPAAVPPVFGGYHAPPRGLSPGGWQGRGAERVVLGHLCGLPLSGEQGGSSPSGSRGAPARVRGAGRGVSGSEEREGLSPHPSCWEPGGHCGSLGHRPARTPGRGGTCLLSASAHAPVRQEGRGSPPASGPQRVSHGGPGGRKGAQAAPGSCHFPAQSCCAREGSGDGPGASSQKVAPWSPPGEGPHRPRPSQPPGLVGFGSQEVSLVKRGLTGVTARLRGSEEGKRGLSPSWSPEPGSVQPRWRAQLIGKGLGRVRGSEPQERPPCWGGGSPAAGSPRRGGLASGGACRQRGSGVGRAHQDPLRCPQLAGVPSAQWHAAGRPPSEQGRGWAAQGPGPAPRGLALSKAYVCVCGGDKCSLARGLLCGSRSSVTEGGLCPPVPTGSPWLSEEGCLLGSPVSGSSHPPRGGLSPQMPVCQAGGVHGAIWPWAPWEVVFLWETAEVGERWRWGRGPSARQPDKIETTK